MKPRVPPNIITVAQKIVEYIYKTLKYCEKFQMSLKIWQEFLSGNWQYGSNIYVLPTAPLFSGP
jgi:hypothetical protein